MANTNMSPSRQLPARNDTHDTETSAFWQRYQQLKDLESEKDQVIEDIFSRYETARKRLVEGYTHYEIFKKATKGDPFVAVILDGESMLFHDDLLSDGCSGGNRAASILESSVRGYVFDILPQLQLPRDIKVVCCIYANFRTIAEIAIPAGIIDDISKVEGFARGFTQTYPSFNFVDVRSENGVAMKVAETVSHHLGDIRCKHIVLGCSANAALVPFLNEISVTDPKCVSRISLLHGLPFHADYTFTKTFEKMIYGSLFRNSLPTQAYGSPISQPPGLSSRKTSCASAVDSGVHTPATTAATPALSWAAKAKAAINLPVPTLASPAMTPRTPNLKKAVGKENSTSRTVSPTTSLATPDEHGIPRNQKGQRVDPPAKVYNKDEVNRIKKMKLCNVHFLRPPCPYFQDCSHLHNYKPAKGEIDTLRLVARMAPCQWGTECADPECIYGHRCPAPQRKDSSTCKEARAEGKSCIFGVQCRFSGEMHD